MGLLLYQKSKALSNRYSYEVVYSRIVDHDAAVINNTILLLFYIIKSINDGLAYNIGMCPDEISKRYRMYLKPALLSVALRGVEI